MWAVFRAWFKTRILRRHLSYWEVEALAKHFIRREYEIAIFDNVCWLRYELVVWMNDRVSIVHAHGISFYYDEMMAHGIPPKMVSVFSRSGGLREWRRMMIEEVKAGT